jgi:2,4-dienoyl-CoA reductase-like NADH-dependent reductase (Old Yellow Enzyme family)/thioredoxin reductase
MFDALFSPIKLRGLELPNRVILPGADTKMACPPTQKLIDYHVAIAKGGCGLNILEVTAVHPTSHGTCYNGLYKPEHAEALKPLTKAVHEAGGRMAIQLWHGGYVPLMFLPDGQDGWFTPVMGYDEINEVIKYFGIATKLAVEAGFDAIELHGAHSYLVHAFMSSGLNFSPLEDYSGSRENRARFMTQVVDEMRKNMPDDMPLIMRINSSDDTTPNGCNTDDYIWFANRAVEHGVDMINVSRGLSSGDELKYEVPSMELERGYNRESVQRFKKEVNAPICGVGRISTPEIANSWIEDGVSDMVAVCRGQITDHEWCNKARTGHPEAIRLCMGCDEGCFDAICDGERKTITCTHNPKVSREAEVLKPDGEGRKAMVIGGGYGGILCAEFLKARKYDVSLYEAAPVLGGNFIYAGAAPHKQEMACALRWDAEELDRLGVKVKTGIKVTPELIEKEKPFKVVIATGGVPVVPEVPGTENTVTFDRVMSGMETVSGNVAVIGSDGYVGTDVAIYLAANGCSVTCISPDIRMSMGLGLTRNIYVGHLVNDYGIKSILQAQVTGFEKGRVLYTDKDGAACAFECDAIVLAAGLKSRSTAELEEKCKKMGIPYKVAGLADPESDDVRKVAESAYFAARDI